MSYSISLGSFCLDSDMGEAMRYGGLTLMLCGFLYVVSFLIQSKTYEYITVKAGQIRKW